MSSNSLTSPLKSPLRSAGSTRRMEGSGGASGTGRTGGAPQRPLNVWGTGSAPMHMLRQVVERVMIVAAVASAAPAAGAVGGVVGGDASGNDERGESSLEDARAVSGSVSPTELASNRWGSGTRRKSGTFGEANPQKQTLTLPLIPTLCRHLAQVSVHCSALVDAGQSQREVSDPDRASS